MTCSSVRKCSTSRQIQNWSRNIQLSAATILWKGGSLNRIMLVIVFSTVKDRLYSTKTSPRWPTKGRRCQLTRSMTSTIDLVMCLQAPCTDIKPNSEDKLQEFAEDPKTTLWCMVASSLVFHTIITKCMMIASQITLKCPVISKEATHLTVPFPEWRAVILVCTSHLSVNAPPKLSRRPNKRISITFSSAVHNPPMN